MATRPDLMVDVLLLDEGDDDPVGPAGPGPEQVDPARRRQRRRRGAALLTGAALVALGVGVQTWQERVAADRRTALAGLVEPLADPLAQAWRVEIPDGAWVLGNVLVTMDASGQVLTGHDVHDGAPTWIADVPLDARVTRCVTTDPSDDPQVICGAGSRGTVMVVDAADGTVSTLAGPDEVDALAATGPDLVRLTRAADGVQVDRVDPRTGSVVWSTVLAVPGLEGADLAAGDGLVTLGGRSAAVVDAADGSVVGTWAGSDRSRTVGARAALVRTTPTGFGVWLELDGRSAAPGGEWFRSDGEPVGTVDGFPLTAPGDGSDHGVLLTVSGSAELPTAARGTVLRAIRDGAVLWAARAEDGLPVLLAEGRAILAGPGVLRAVDLTTGVQVWRVDVADVDEVTSISDGRYVLVVRSDVSGGRRLTAYATADGTVAWSVPMEPGWELVPSGADVVLVRDGVAIIGLR